MSERRPEAYYRSVEAIVRWARSRAYRLRRAMAAYVRRFIEEVLGVRGIRLDVRTAEKVLQALEGARVRVPQLARQIAQRNPRLRRRWLSELRRALRRKTAVYLIEKALEEARLAEAYRVLAQNPEDVIVSAIRAARGWSWEDLRTLRCVLQEYGLPSALAELFASGRLCAPGAIMVRVLRILQYREPGLPLYIIYWREDCVPPTPDVYAYPGRAPPKEYKRLRDAKCMMAIGDRYWQPKARDIRSEWLQHIAGAPVACIYVRADYAWRESDCPSWQRWS